MVSYYSLDMVIRDKRGVAGRHVPGSGATSFGAALRGASKSICVGSSSEGAIVYVRAKECVKWLHGRVLVEKAKEAC
jgi:hypothetical protein